MKKILFILLLLILFMPDAHAKARVRRYPSNTPVTAATQSGDIAAGNCVEADASGNLVDSGGVCGGAGSGDSVTVNSTAVDTTANFLDGDIDFSVADGGAGGPDTVTATLDATYEASLNVATAGALAANGANCSAGSYALGVDASGASEGCTDATTEIDSAISTHNSSADHSTTTAGDYLTRTTDDFDLDLEVVQGTLVGVIGFEDPVATDDFQGFAYAPKDFTITAIYCKTDTGTVDLDIQLDDGTPADVNGTDITCTSSGVYDSSLAGDTGFATGEQMDLAITSVATSPGELFVQVFGTTDDV